MQNKCKKTILLSLIFTIFILSFPSKYYQYHALSEPIVDDMFFIAPYEDYENYYDVEVLIDEEGKIAHIWPKVSVKGHAEDVKKVLAEILAIA